MIPEPAPRDWGYLALILLLALALRLPGLDGPLWYDEILTVTRHLRLDWAEMMSSYSMNFHYLHNLQAKAAVMQWGEQPWVIRLPALLFGLGSIATVWALAWRISTPAVAHVTALLLAVSFHHIWFSQNARGYTELAFWSSLGTILWLEAMRNPTRGLWLGYALTLVLATFTHLTGAFLFAAHGVIWLGALLWGAARGTASRDLLTWGVIGYGLGGLLSILLYIPVLPGMIETIGGVSGTSAVDVMQEYQNPLWTALEAIRTGLGTAGPEVLIVGTLVLLLVIVGSARMGKAPLFPLMVVLHFAVTIALLLTLGMRIWPRFFFPDIGFLMLLIVLGVASFCTLFARLPGLRRVGQWLFPAAAVAMLAISGVLAARNYLAPKQDLAGAVAFVSDQRQAGEPVYALGPAAAVFADYFAQDWIALQTEADWSEAMQTPGPFIAVVAFPGRMFRTIPEMDTAVEDGRVTLLVDLPGTLGDGHVSILRRPGE